MSRRYSLNARWKRMFDTKTNLHGQTCTLVRHGEAKKCPCFDEGTGYGDPQWHRDNPDAEQCNSDGNLESSTSKEDVFAFIYPANSVNDLDLEEILANIGKIKKDDYVYIGKSDTDIFNLSDNDYLIYNNRKWKISNPDVYAIGDFQLAYSAILSMIRSDYDG